MINKLLSSKKIMCFLIFIILVAGLLLYARFVGTSGIIINEYKIVNSNLPNNFYGFKIVHISDLHYGRTFDKNDLDLLIEKISLLKPDIVVLTGDLLDKDISLSDKEILELEEGLNSIEATIGKYATSGNHDEEHPEWSNIINESGFTNLNDTSVLIYNNGLDPILLSGMSSNLNDDTSIDNKIISINKNIMINEETSELNTYKFNILLIHEPDYLDNFDYSNYNLVLAGHSHNGQVRLPFIGALILPEGSKKYYEPYYKLNNSDLYISNGLGTSTVNFRLFNRPSINLYRLVNK
ncbi:MAG: metallophosphoesterase [Bacilli bacterium]|nr:metallophosphoesterase [Bacilli bacterium]